MPRRPLATRVSKAKVCMCPFLYTPGLSLHAPSLYPLPSPPSSQSLSHVTQSMSGVGSQPSSWAGGSAVGVDLNLRCLGGRPSLPFPTGPGLGAVFGGASHPSSSIIMGVGEAWDSEGSEMTTWWGTAPGKPSWTVTGVGSGDFVLPTNNVNCCHCLGCLLGSGESEEE